MIGRFRHVLMSLTGHAFALWSAATGRDDRDAFACHLFAVCALATLVHLVLLLHHLNAWTLINDLPFLAVATQAAASRTWRGSVPVLFPSGIVQLTADLSAVEALADLVRVAFAPAAAFLTDARIADLVDSLAWTLAVYAMLFPPPPRRRRTADVTELVRRLLRRRAPAPAPSGA